MRKQAYIFTAVMLTIVAFCLLLPHKAAVSTPGPYADATLWYQNGRSIDPELADVFYILPTCVFDWTDSTGTRQRYASLTDPGQREAMRPSYELADRIFADSANFFSPYYRQISLDVWMEGEQAVEELFPLSMEDIRSAFSHYLREWNGGRPFVLAGFSQGGKCVVELIKEMDSETASRLAAAYVCGYKVTQDDVDTSPWLRLARGAEDTGVTIVYNTVSDLDAVTPTLGSGNIAAINPASWTTDSLPHALNDSVSIAISPAAKVLICSGIDPQTAFHPSLERLLPYGNLHLLELTLYEEQLRSNVKTRIRNFTTQP